MPELSFKLYLAYLLYCIIYWPKYSYLY
uniref:Uncharacterized protein n=1 Tax=Anguilla anguilla TaxID=7936 RepID=A0A0E9W0I4_ANGAN